MNNQEAKADAGKIRPSLVPLQMVRDAAEIREYGCKKYHEPDNWKKVEKQRYVDAMLRHLMAWLENPDGVDSESGLSHWKHFVCNVAFVSDLNVNQYSVGCDGKIVKIMEEKLDGGEENF